MDKDYTKGISRKTHKWLTNPQKRINFIHNEVNTKHQRPTVFHVSERQNVTKKSVSAMLWGNGQFVFGMNENSYS